MHTEVGTALVLIVIYLQFIFADIYCRFYDRYANIYSFDCLKDN